MQIEWDRLSEPQADGYDVEILKLRLKEIRGYEKKVCGSDFLDNVAITPYTESFNPGRWQPKLENIKKVEETMQIWPELILSYQGLIEFIIFCHETTDYSWNATYGCSCGHIYFNHDGVTPGSIGVFVGMLGTLGTLEALAHEVGHLRLHMLGIHIEDHDGQLILNGPDELFTSPIRKDKPRPMSAVLQAQYSYVMVSDMDLKYFDATENDKKKQCAINYLKMNIPRIAKGHDEVRNNIRTTENGAKFMDGFWCYSDKVIERGLKLIG